MFRQCQLKEACLEDVERTVQGSVRLGAISLEFWDGVCSRRKAGGCQGGWWFEVVSS